MSTITPLVLADGQSTPVDQTFSVITPQQGLTPAKWLNRVGGSYAAYAEVTHLLSRKGTSERVSVKVRVPYLNDNGSRRGQNMFTGVFILDDNCTAAERKDLLAYAIGVLTAQLTDDSVTNSEPTH